MPDKYKKAFVFNFNYCVWMKTSCHTICCMFQILPVEQTFWNTWWYHRIQCHMYHIFMQSENKSSFRPISARLGFPCWKQQLDCEWKMWELWGKC